MEKNVNIERDVTVGNNATIGGRVLVQAGMTVKHNVRVDGWLDAPNIKGAAKGLFETADKLSSAYPNPDDGWWALVGTTLPAEIYIAQDGKWVDTGNTGGSPTVDSNYLDSAVQDLQTQMEKRAAIDDNLEERINTEEDNRKEADEAEATARKEADTALQEQIDSLLYPTIDIGSLDTLSSLPDTKHSRYVVTYMHLSTTARVAGILDVFGDGWGHVTTQVLTSHCALGNDGKLDVSGNHMDGFVTQYYRSYNIQSPTLSIDKNTWTDWKPVNDAYIDTAVTDLQETIANSIPQLVEDVVAAVGDLPATTGKLYFVRDTDNAINAIYKTYGTAGKGSYIADADEKTLYVNKADNAIYRWTEADGLVQIAGDLLHTSDKGVAGGVAPLDSNAQIPSKYIPDTFADVVMLRGLYDTAPKAQYIIGSPSRYYNTTDGKLYVIGTETTSAGAIKYVWVEETLSEDKLYCDVSTNSLYRYVPAQAAAGTQGKLVAISVNADEEEKRVEAEKARAEAEAARVTAEAARVKAENTREDNEADRQAAETARVKAERSRTVAEGDRAEHEADRQTAEAKREDDFEVIKSTFTSTEAEAKEVIADTKTATEATKAATEAAQTATANAQAATEKANTATTKANTAAANADAATEAAKTATANADTATANANNAAQKANTAAERVEAAVAKAENVNAELSDTNVLTVTNAGGESKTVDLMSVAEAGDIKTSAERSSLALGHYSDRDDITLVATETGKAISSDGVKVGKTGWAIAEFTAEKGNEYLFKPGETDGTVCVFAEYIDKVEDRAIDYTYTYNADGTVATAQATYGGKTYKYTYAYDAGGNATITDASGTVVSSLPLLYTTTVGSYSPLVRLNADAELPSDGYCRFMSHFQGNNSLKVVVSYKVGSADLTMKVLRDGVFASISTQLGNIAQKLSDTASELAKVQESYVDVKARAACSVTVDGQSVTLEAMKMTRLYPKLSLYLNNKNVVVVRAGRWDTSKVTSMGSMFNGCSNLATLDVSGWDTSKVTSMGSMFNGCSNLATLDVSGWDTSKVTYMGFLFKGCSKLTSLDVSGWDTAAVTWMQQVFYGCSGLTALDLSGWDVSNSNEMQGFLNGCVNLTTLIGSHTLEEVESGEVVALKGMKKYLNITDETKLDRKSLLAVIKGLADITGGTSQTLTLGSTLKAKLTADDIKIATDKGWVVA